MVGFHPTCTRLATKPVTNPMAKNGNNTIKDLATRIRKIPLIVPIVIPSPFIDTISGIIAYIQANISSIRVPANPRNILSPKKNPSNAIPLTISLLLATLPSFLASESFLLVGCSVFSPPSPSGAKN